MNMSVNTSIETQDPALWQDPKRYGWLLSPALPLIGTAIGVFAIPSTKTEKYSKLNTLLCFAGPILVHAIIPALDIIVGTDHSNPPDEAMKRLQEDPYYKRIAYAFVPLQYLTLGIIARKFAKSENAPLLAKLGMALSAGTINGIAINTAHELGHKKGKMDNWMAKLSLAPTSYGHFVVEHNYGHHKNVATPLDPASSRFGETFYQFLPRTVIGSFRSAIEIETARLARKGKSFWTKDNELLQSWGLSAALYAGLYKAFGAKVIPFIAIQAVYGFSLLEVVNYLEHYGLKRPQREDGSYSRTLPEHSWNSNHVITNLFLYQLQRHSDHHAHPTRDFQMLRHFDEAPQLPSGYASMITLAYFPKLWFKVMNPKVMKHYDGDTSLMNLYDKQERPVRELIGDISGAVASKTLGKIGSLLQKV